MAPAAMAKHAVVTATILADDFRICSGHGGLPFGDLLWRVTLHEKMPTSASWLLENKYYIDELYQKIFVSKFVSIGNTFWEKAYATGYRWLRWLTVQRA